MTLLRRRYAVFGAVFFLIGLFLCLFWVANRIVTSGKLLTILDWATHDVSVRYAAAEGTVLTQFRFKDLVVSGEDSHVIWKISLKEATVSPSLLRLFSKIFQTSQLIGSGLSFHLQFKKQTQPSIDDDSYLDHWRVRIEHIQLDHIAEIMINSVSLPAGGDTSLRSAFYFWPGYELQIEPSEFRSKIESLDTQLKFRLDQIRFREVPGFTFFHKFSGELAVQGESPNLRFLNYYFRAVPWFSIEGSGVHLNALLQVERGIVQPGTHGDLDVKQLALKIPHFSAVGSGKVKFDPVRFSVHLGNPRVHPIRAQSKHLGLVITSTQIDLADPLADANRIELDIEHLVAHLLASTVRTNFKFDATVSHISTHSEILQIPKITCDLTQLQIEKGPTPSEAQLEKWWGKVTVDNATLASTSHPVFSGVAHFSARDGRPLSLLLKNTRVLPVNLAGLIPMNDLTAATKFKFDQNEIRFKDFRLQSSTLQAAGQLTLKEGQKFGNIKIKNPIHSFEVVFKGKDTRLKW